MSTGGYPYFKIKVAVMREAGFTATEAGKLTLIEAWQALGAEVMS